MRWFTTISYRVNTFKLYPKYAKVSAEMFMVWKGAFNDNLLACTGWSKHVLFVVN